MSTMKMRKVQRTVASVAAGSAANSTLSYYINMKEFRKLGLQLEWTAGAGGGTVAVILYGSMQNAANATAAASIAYDDITNATFGVASWTDDFIAADNDEKLACYTWLKVTVQVANKDASTAYTLDAVLVG